jgi:hypothetical protein
MLIPVLLIPQILFSGHTVEVKDMSPPVLAISQLLPSFAAERIFDTSLLLNQRLTGQFPQDYPLPYYNINAWYRSITGERLKAGTTYLQARPIWVGYLSLVLWTIAGFGACFILLGRKERETE